MRKESAHMRYIHTIAIALPLMARPALAADIHTVFDMQLQQPFTVAECPYVHISKKAGYYNPPTNGACYEYIDEANQGKQHVVANDTVKITWLTTPHLVIGRYAIGTIIKGKLEGVSFNTLGIQSQQRDYDALRQKYGEPTETVQSTVQNAYGATYTPIRATWKMDDMIVSIDSAPGRMDSGFVRVETVMAVAERKAALEKIGRGGPSL
jgi:hypothetical protein